MEEHIKNIIEKKRYFELTEKEKQLIGDWAENEDEFEALKMTFLAANELKSEQQEQLSPSIKTSLNEKFAAKHTHQKEMWLNKLMLFFFPKNTQFYKKPAFQLAMVALVSFLIIPFLWQNDTPQYAMKKKEVQVEKLDEKQEDKKQEITAEEDTEESTTINKEIKNKEEPVPEIKPEEEQPGHKIKTFESLEEPVHHPLDKNKAKLEATIQQNTEEELAEQTRPELQPSEDMQMDFIKKDGVGANQTPSKQVDAEETLDLLTVLY